MRQSQIVQSAIDSYDAVIITQFLYSWFCIDLASQLGILRGHKILAVSMFDVCMFIHRSRITYYAKVVFNVASYADAL